MSNNEVGLDSTKERVEHLMERVENSQTQKDWSKDMINKSPNRENSYLKEAELVVLGEILSTEKDKLFAKYNDGDDRFCLDKNELSDVLDEASINIQATSELRFRNREVFYLKKIKKALDRIRYGVYGLCEDCGAEIGFGRLKARPTAELCIVCKEENEMTEFNTIFAKKSQSLGKTISEL